MNKEEAIKFLKSQRHLMDKDLKKIKEVTDSLIENDDDGFTIGPKTDDDLKKLIEEIENQSEDEKE